MVGAVRDRQNRLAEAEGAFSSALHHHEAAYGDGSEAVADTARSLALIQLKGGGARRAQAKINLARALSIYEDMNPALASEMSRYLAEVAFDSEVLDEAMVHFKKAEQLALRAPGHAGLDRLLARDGIARVFWKQKDFSRAFDVYMRSTRLLTVGVSASERHLMAWVWNQLGSLSVAWRALFEASFAFHMAVDLGGAAASVAKERLERLSPPASRPEPFEAWRLTMYNEAEHKGHVAHPRLGLYPFRGTVAGASVGDSVGVAIDRGHAIVTETI